VAYVRTVKTASGATAVQIVWSYHRGSRKIEHLGSAHDDAGLELLKAAARQRLAAGHARGPRSSLGLAARDGVVSADAALLSQLGSPGSGGGTALPLCLVW
jgi:hypothetical protein